MIIKSVLCALALVAAVGSVSACSDGANDNDVKTNGPKSNAKPATKTRQPTDHRDRPEMLSGFSCAPLVSVSSQLVSCGARQAAELAEASALESELVAAMNAAMAEVSLMPNWDLNQVTISSSLPDFTTLFGTSLVAPLASSGYFDMTAPIALSLPGSLDAQLELELSGYVPALDGTILSSPAFLPGFDDLAFSNLWPGIGTSTYDSSYSSKSTSSYDAQSSFDVNAARNVAQNASEHASGSERETYASQSIPLSVSIATPHAVAAPVSCSGALPLGCL